MPTVKPPVIPEISNRRLKKLARQIRSVVCFTKLPMGKYPQDDVRAYYIDFPKDLRGHNFLHRPRRRGRAHVVQLCKIKTFHVPGSAGREFHPTIAEVFAQIPQDFLDQIVAFETLRPSLQDGEYDETGTFHVTTTVLLERASS